MKDYTPPGSVPGNERQRYFKKASFRFLLTLGSLALASSWPLPVPPQQTFTARIIAMRGSPQRSLISQASAGSCMSVPYFNSPFKSLRSNWDRDVVSNGCCHFDNRFRIGVFNIHIKTTIQPGKRDFRSADPMFLCNFTDASTTF